MNWEPDRRNRRGRSKKRGKGKEWNEERIGKVWTERDRGRI